MKGKFTCYHTTTSDREASILQHGLVPGSPPNWFLREPVPYVMLSLEPWYNLHEWDNVVFEISDPAIKKEMFIDEEGLRWADTIHSGYLRAIYFQGVPKEEINE
ncbi:hypothetical protein LCGC14_2865110 [marine sediment metagenome]|uniref:Uncharacterized protein n=1 Tax=marine sediment metagenome TaxID=412755 RepID=A0A0F9AVP9_9ZZZZ